MPLQQLKKVTEVVVCVLKSNSNLRKKTHGNDWKWCLNIHRSEMLKHQYSLAFPAETSSLDCGLISRGGWGCVHTTHTHTHTHTHRCGPLTSNDYFSSIWLHKPGVILPAREQTRERRRDEVSESPLSVSLSLLSLFFFFKTSFTAARPDEEWNKTPPVEEVGGVWTRCMSSSQHQKPSETISEAWWPQYHPSLETHWGSALWLGRRHSGPTAPQCGILWNYSNTVSFSPLFFPSLVVVNF